jgi:Carboxypeptidase regulatory-like domain/TonB-dependent Receptor Plug Domain
MLSQVARRRPSFAALTTLALVVFCAQLHAQEINATVTGTVIDPQGAILPGVTVTLLNVATNVASETITNTQGAYAVQKLIPGPYRLTAALQGFKTYVRDGVVLHTAEVATVNIPLTLGAVEENVTVTAQLSEVETNQSTLAQTMENRRVSELPLNGRQVYMLLQMTAGTIFTQTQFGAQGFSGTRAWDVNGSVTIHGSRTGNNEFLIDGATNAGTGGWTYAPPVDAIEEFKVQSASTDASYGRTSGGVVNLRLRSGANDLHGSGTLLFRGTALDSNSIQNIANNISNEGHEYVDGEGMISGPVVRSRTFFMGGYQGFRENIPFPSIATLPTAAQLTGDFRGTLNGSGQQITIYDPLSTHPDPERPGRLVRDPISCNGAVNVICPDRINPVARALLAFMPHANAAGDVTGSNNFIASPNTGFYRYNTYLTRIDHNFSDRHRIALSNSGNWGTERRNENSLPAPALRSDNWPTHRNHYLATVEDTITLNPTTLVNTRVAFDRFAEPHTKEFGVLTDTTLPFATPYQVTSNLGFGAWFPHLTFTNNPYTEMFGRPPRESDNNIYQAQSVVSKTMGKHLVKVGGDFRLYQLIRTDYNEANGRYDFQKDFTQRDPQQGDATSGNAFASLLLGYPTQASTNTFVSINATSDRRYQYYDLFVQDDWHMGERATLGLGLRWDYQAPVYEKNDKLVTGFDTRTPSPLKVPGLNVVGGLLFANQTGPKSPYKSDWTNIQPRASFAYKISDRLVARSNYGRTFLPLTGCCGGVIQTGFSQDTLMITSIQTGLPFNTLSNPYPNGFLQPANGGEGLLTGVGTNISFVNPDFVVPYADLWMAGLNIELPWNIGLNLAYVGNRVTELPTNNNTEINAVPLAEQRKAIERLGGNASYLSTLVPNPFAGLVNPIVALNNPTINRGQLLRPFPQFNNIRESLDNKGWSKYHAFELVANKRFSRGFHASINYTLSRLREAVDYLNNGFEATPYEDLASVDRTHHITVTALYELPFGPGKAIAGNATGLVAAVIGGWQFNVLHEYESGTPTAMPSGQLKAGCDPRLPSGQQTLDHWFDTSCFTVTPPNDFRTTPFRMSDVRDPSITNTAFSLFKSNRIGQVNVQLRGELFNPFNIRIYGGPNTTITSPQFGRITPNQFNFPRTGQIGVRVTF